MSSLRTYLQLMRFPAVFTAMGDIVLGFLLNHPKYDEGPLDLGLLILASACLYLAGMIFNDVFDRTIDAQERPERPIPSGRVSVMNASTLGGLLILAGIGAASVVGTQSLIVAGLLTACIFLYNGWAKKTPFGPVVMGSCRLLNVILGASGYERAFQVWGNWRLWESGTQFPQPWIALGLGIYIAGVTWFARQEARQSDRRHLLGGLAVANAGLLLLILWAWMIRIPLSDQERNMSVLCLAVIVAIINRQPILALRDPNPGRVQMAVRTMLLSLIMLDATLIYIQSSDPVPAIAVACLLIPAMFLGRWIFVT